MISTEMHSYWLFLSLTIATNHATEVATKIIDARTEAEEIISEIAKRLGIKANIWLIADMGFGLRVSSSGVIRAKPAYAIEDGMLMANSTNITIDSD